MSRPDEYTNPIRIGDAPPVFPLRKPFDLSPWQFVATLCCVAVIATVDSILPLDDTPFEEGTWLSPLMVARVVVLFAGLCVTLIHPGGRWIPVWILVALKHWWDAQPAVSSANGDDPNYFEEDAEKMFRVYLEGNEAIFYEEPPFWWLLKRTPFAEPYWARHMPYRLALIAEAQGALELMTDTDREARWKALWAGIKAFRYPVQFVAQARPEDVNWLLDHSLPPVGSRFAWLRDAIERWIRVKAPQMMQRRIIVVCSAPDVDALLEHVKDVSGALADAALAARQCSVAELREIFKQSYGNRELSPHDSTYFGVDGQKWSTIAIRLFPKDVVVGWIMYVIGNLPVNVAMYTEPDDAMWVQKITEWFDGMCQFPTADINHHDAFEDLTRVQAKIKRNEDALQRITLLMTMPPQYVERVSNNLKKAGAVFREATHEHMSGFVSTTPRGGLPKIGPTRPYDSAAAAAVFPFGASGLRMPGVLLGSARTEAVALDISDKALYAKMICALGTTGAGKTFLLQEYIVRSGYPFTLIDLKPHLNARKHGDYWPLLNSCAGDYIVVTDPHAIPFVDSDAVCYNLASLTKAQQAEALLSIAEWEWEHQLDSLAPRIFGVDEANILAKTQGGRDFIERVATQGRNANVIGFFASQEVADFLKNEQTKKAVTMSPVLIVMAQNHREVDVVAAKLALGDAATEELRKFQPNPGDTLGASTRRAIMRVGRRMVSFNIEVCPEEKALYTTDADEKRARLEDVELLAA